MTDRGAPPGDAPELARLEDWWARTIGATRGPLRATRFPGGFSNLTYLVEDDAGAWVVRRPPPDVRGGIAHDVLREHRVLEAVHPRFPLAPRPIARCEDPAVLGAPFFVMAHVPGRILRGGDASAAALTPDAARAVGDAVVDTLAALHAVPVAEGPLAALGRPDGYVERQVAGWRARWERARTSPQPAVEGAAAWLAEQLPKSQGAVLVHNDFKHDNLVLAEASAEVRGVLDWELATVGCPQLDLGTTLGYWVQGDDPPALRKLGLGVTTLEGTPSRAEVVRRYETSSGRPIPDPTWAYVFGLFKVAVIAQQLLARHEAGTARDPRYAALGIAVTALGERARAAIAADSISGT